MQFSINHIPVLDSTNKHIQLLLENEDLLEGTVIWADEQTDGRGYGDNKWESMPGKNLLLSLILKPQFIKASEQFILTEIVSLALVSLIKKHLPNRNVSIKWPNDIYVDNMKIAGILIQNTIRGSQIGHSILGVGLNINQKEFSKKLPNPVSLAKLSGLDYAIEDILHDLLAHINRYYSHTFSSKGCQELRKEYYSYLFRFEEWSRFKGAEEFTAKIKGINEYGQLSLQLESGETKEYGFKDIEFVI